MKDWATLLGGNVKLELTFEI